MYNVFFLIYEHLITRIFITKRVFTGCVRRHISHDSTYPVSTPLEYSGSQYHCPGLRMTWTAPRAMPPSPQNKYKGLTNEDSHTSTQNPTNETRKQIYIYLSIYSHNNVTNHITANFKITKNFIVKNVLKQLQFSIRQEYNVV